MNTFWLKIAAGAVGLVVVIILIGTFTSNDSKPTQPAEPEKTFHDQVEEDKENFLAEAKPLETPPQTPTTEQQSSLQAQAQTQQAQVQTQTEPPKPVVLYFKPLSEIDDIEAQRLINVAVPGRSIGRLPMTGYNLMVPNCREIIKRWPDSQYAYQAKRLLADIPERFWQRYNITEKERDVSMFYKQRPGTEPYTMEGTR